MQALLSVVVAVGTLATPAASADGAGRDVLRRVPGCQDVARGCVWDNIPSTYVRMAAHASQNDAVYPFRSGSADDFVCGACDPPASDCMVTALQWWGTFWNPGPPSNITAFEINFYADDGNQPTGAGLENPRPTAVAAFNVPIEEISVMELDNLWQYTYTFPNDGLAVLACYQHYWLEIVSISTYPPQWGLVTAADDQTMAMAVEGFPALSMPYWTSLEVDLPFRVWSTCAGGLRGDLNCDSVIDNFDINPFVLALTDRTAYVAAYPNCDPDLADINHDGAVDNFDINPLVALLVGG